ncbi:ATP-binding cassette domain-containing protein [Tabrizicola piscis]|uniref:ATP-binding cassette domain-containing protein n=1 Tax=Tabrizicola piscis TaxID=2494374 RepID=A0A3S8U750_9RHOB|nr:ATP-binding cassette domain-containing protein [Tabrizicola piscis]AZL59522.1 ATP-binding cassette domain-containing protein [Tabrizicola piscis]
MNAPVGAPRLAIEISHLNHWYGEGDLRRLVLRDLSLTVERGKTTFLMGPSGCGKTTLLTLVGALRSVMEGSVKVLGHELLGASETVMVETRRLAGFIFQHHNLHRSLTVLQNVRMGLEVKGEAGAQDATARCMEVISAVGLSEHMHKYQDQISGGQKQRAAIARALVGKPELLLADEPTAALDSKTGREVIELVQRLASERGMTVLMVTHDNRILDIADRIVEMEDGRILAETGPKAEEIAHPARAKTARTKA